MAWKDMKAAFYTRRSLGTHGALVRRQSRWVVSCGGRSGWSNGALKRLRSRGEAHPALGLCSSLHHATFRTWEGRTQLREMLAWPLNGKGMERRGSNQPSNPPEADNKRRAWAAKQTSSKSLLSSLPANRHQIVHQSQTSARSHS